MNWLHYLLEANLYLAVFYAGYYLFLRRETYYTLNRIYLLFSCIASFALPVMQLGILKPVEQPITAVHFTYVIPSTTFIPVYTAPAAPVFTWQDAIVDTYLFGAAVFLMVLLIKLYQLLKLTRVKHPGVGGSYKVVHLNGSDTAFSFFNYLFIGTKVHQAEMIIKHELVHIRQKHSADIIFIELLKIVNWFNPVVYLLQHSLREIHEYIADEKIAASGTDALAYSSFLVSNAYGLSGSSITHSFFNYNLLKKRIIMLHQKRSGSLARLRYLLAIPICAGLLCASTLAFSKTYGWVDIAPHRINKLNMSSQVREPAKHLLISEKNGTRIIANNFALKRRDGTTKNITAYNLSNKDRVDFKTQGYTVDVVSAPDTNITLHLLPPPPAPPVKQVKFPPPMIRTPKGYLYSEDYYLKNDKRDMTVTFHEKGGLHKRFTKSKATPAEIALLKDKYGYVFPELLRLLPPPPAPPIKRVKFPLPKPLPNKTAKGYLYSEAGYFENGKQDVVVTFQEKDGSHKEYDKNKATAADLALLKEKYGYVFRPQLHMLPPPPPPAPPKHTAHKLPPPVVVPDGKTPPPPPPASPHHTTRKFTPPVVVPDGKTPPPAPPTVYTKKGYKYKEDGYVVDGKTDFRVTIFEKTGNQLSLFKSKASDAEVKMLKDKYGYSFPNMDIHDRMPPPPPEPPTGSKLSASTWKGVVFTPKNAENANMNPVLVVDGEVKDFNVHLQKGQKLVVDASDSVHAVVYSDADLKDAVQKYGENAKNGVIFAYGKTSVTVK